MKNSKFKIQNLKFKNGFTLVELLVAMGLFLVLVGIVADSFTRVLRTQRLVIALIAVNNNVNLTLEQIAREMRTGYLFQKISDSELAFINADNILVFYRLNQGAIERGTKESIDSETIYKKVTADNVRINNFNINLVGEVVGDGYPTRITISLSASTNQRGLGEAMVNVQTTISTRMIFDG